MKQENAVVKDIVVKRDEGVTITFDDDLVASFNLVEVRLNCPCASCRNFRETGQECWPRPGSPTPLRIADASLHGAWGLNIAWNDGHASGIFPFDSFRRWAEGHAPFGPDSGLPGAARTPPI